MTELTNAQIRFVNSFRAKQKILKSSRLSGQTKKFKNVPNTAKVSMTEFGDYSDSYLETCSLTLERLTRINASIMLNLLMDHATNKEGYIRYLNVRNNVVSIGAPVHRFMNLMRRANTRELKCACCGTVATLCYFERMISKHTVKSKASKKHPYHLAFYGVTEDHKERLFTVDHIAAKSKSNNSSIKNLQPMCKHCNSLKAALPNDVFLSLGADALKLIQEKSKGH